MLKDWVKSNRLSKAADAVNLLITRIEMEHASQDNSEEQNPQSRKTNQIQIQDSNDLKIIIHKMVFLKN